MRAAEIFSYISVRVKWATLQVRTEDEGYFRYVFWLHEEQSEYGPRLCALTGAVAEILYTNY